MRPLTLMGLIASAVALCIGGGVGGDAVGSPVSKQKPKGPRIILRDSQFGKILLDSRRQAIYLFAKEKSRKPECYGACARAWLPVYAKGKPRAGRGVDPRLLGTTRRRGGRRQVTYGGHPLYFYAHEDPGQVLRQNVIQFGGLWLVVKANGEPVPSGR